MGFSRTEGNTAAAVTRSDLLVTQLEAYFTRRHIRKNIFLHCNDFRWNFSWVCAPLLLATTSQLNGSPDLGQGAQLLCHVYALRFREILRTELQ